MKFDHRDVVAKRQNQSFKTKSLKIDMVLEKSSFDSSITKLSTEILKQLNKRGDQWTTELKVLHHTKIKERMQLARKLSEYKTNLFGDVRVVQDQLRVWKI